MTVSVAAPCRTLTIAADDVFDGRDWRGPGVVDVGDGIVTGYRVGGSAEEADCRASVVTPGLVDVGVRLSGYEERADPADPFRSEVGFGLLALRFGVTTVLDLGSPLPQVRRLAWLAARAQAPRVLATGARLVSTPTRRTDVEVEPEEVDELVDGLLALGGRAVSVGRAAPALQARAAAVAGARQVPVIFAQQLPHEPPGLVVVPPGDGSGSRVAAIDSAAADGRYLAPQLESAAAWTVDGLVAVEDKELAAPFLPYARHFRRSRGVVGRRMSREVLRSFYGHRSSAQLDPRLPDATARHLAAGTCLASSDSGAAGIVPGLSLWRELGRLAEVSADSAAVLAAGTGAPSELLGAGVGRIAVGAPADLLCFSGTDRTARPDDLLEALSHVVVSGRVHDVSALSARLSAVVDAAMEEPR